jgi:SAM-dependent methyltransferase
MTGNDSNGNEGAARLKCIACESPKLICWGRLPVYTADFLGRDFDSSANAGFLYECLNCTLRFRDPQPTEADLMNYYQGLDVVECWQHGPEREVWRYIREALTSLPEQSVLDVGCFRGDMLAYLGNGFRHFGVEPSKTASAEAERRGVTIVADRIDGLRNSPLRFGAITLIDVAEHLPKPLEALEILTRLLLPGGKLIIFTGSTDAFTWRLAGVDYYYSAMPEHLAFMRPSWFQWAAAELNCEIGSVKRLRYQSSSLSHRVDEAFRNLLYIGYHRAARMSFLPGGLLELPLVRRVGKWQGCWWTSARDHTLVVMTKKSIGAVGDK